MRNHCIFLALFLGSVIVLPSWADSADSAGGANPSMEKKNPSISNDAAHSALTEQSAANPTRGMLYRVRFKEHIAYLFGTLSNGRSDVAQLEPQSIPGFSEANVYMPELDTRNKQPMENSVLKYAMYAKNDTIEKHISAATLKQLKETLEKNNIPYEIMVR